MQLAKFFIAMPMRSPLVNFSSRFNCEALNECTSVYLLRLCNSSIFPTLLFPRFSLLRTIWNGAGQRNPGVWCRIASPLGIFNFSFDYQPSSRLEKAKIQVHAAHLEVRLDTLPKAFLYEIEIRLGRVRIFSRDESLSAENFQPAGELFEVLSIKRHREPNEK